MDSLAIFGLPNCVKQQSRTEHLHICGQFGGKRSIGLFFPPQTAAIFSQIEN